MVSVGHQRCGVPYSPVYRACFAKDRSHCLFNCQWHWVSDRLCVCRKGDESREGGKERGRKGGKERGRKQAGRGRGEQRGREERREGGWQE